MVQVNQFFKPPNYFPGRILSKTGRKVVQKNWEVMSTFHITLRRSETLWSAREIASMALSAEQARHTENVFHIVLRHTHTWNTMECERESFSGALGGARGTYQMCFTLRNTCGTLWSAREIASVALSAEQERYTKFFSRCLKAVSRCESRKINFFSA